MTARSENMSLARLVLERQPDGYMVRLTSLEERHFPTATRVAKTEYGGVDLYFDRIHLGHFRKEEFKTYWPVQTARKPDKNRRTNRGSR